MVIRCSWSARRARSMQRSSKASSITISSATSCRSQASFACPTSWWCIHRFPPRPFPSFIAYAKANPGKINVESRPAQGPQITWLDMVHIQYRGSGPALIDLLAGQVQVGFDTMPALIEYIRAGRLRALAVCTATRSHALPDLPTVSEFLPGYESSGYFGFGAPARTPAGIVDKLNKEISTGLADPKLKTQFVDLGGIILGGSSADFRTLITEETEKWAKVIRAASIKPE